MPGVVVDSYRIAPGPNAPAAIHERTVTLDVIPIKVERRGRSDEDRWAITGGALVYSRKGWEVEPLPSSRTEAFLRRARWSLAEAFALLDVAAPDRAATPARTSGPPALANGYRVLALFGSRWVEVRTNLDLRGAEYVARGLDATMFEDRANPPKKLSPTTGWAILDSHLRTVSSDTPADCPPPPALAVLLQGVSACDGGGKRACGGTERVVIGFGVQASGFVDVACVKCDARSGMRVEVATACAGASS